LNLIQSIGLFLWLRYNRNLMIRQPIWKLGIWNFKKFFKTGSRKDGRGID